MHMENKRNTIQKQLILDAVRELDNHATAEHVYGYVLKKHPAIRKTTVYRNLSQMSDAGELLNIGSYYGSVRYDHNRHEHAHLVCETCKRVFDVGGDYSDVIGKTPKTDEYDITSCRVSFAGICRECKAVPGA